MPPRSETIQRERRRRQGDALSGTRRKLAWDMSIADHENFVYRWVNDDGIRLHQMWQEDWEVFANRDGTAKPGDNSGVGAEISAYVGVGEQGRPERAVLMRKSKDLHNEDMKAEQRRIDETEAAMRQGAAPGVDTEGLRRPDSGQAISISHQSRA